MEDLVVHYILFLHDLNDGTEGAFQLIRLLHFNTRNLKLFGERFDDVTMIWGITFKKVLLFFLLLLLIVIIILWSIELFIVSITGAVLCGILVVFQYRLIDRTPRRGVSIFLFFIRHL